MIKVELLCCRVHAHGKREERNAEKQQKGNTGGNDRRNRVNRTAERGKRNRKTIIRHSRRAKRKGEHERGHGKPENMNWEFGNRQEEIRRSKSETGKQAFGIRG